MGQKTHPIGLRLGIIKGWDSNWYGGNKYADKLIEDENIRTFLNKRLAKGGISRIVIERTLKRLTITIHSGRPGIIIGKQGSEVEKLKEEIKKFTKKDVHLNIYEINKPETEARLVADNISQQLRARISFRRAMKQAINFAMRNGAEGIKVMCAGRLGGAEMARTEQYKEGRVPLQTLRADIDYATTTSHTIYGAIGIKVWIFKGEVYGKVDLAPQTSGFQNERGGGGDRRGGGNDRRGGGDRRGKGGNDRRGGGNDRRGGGNDRRGGGGGDRRGNNNRGGGRS